MPSTVDPCTLLKAGNLNTQHPLLLQPTILDIPKYQLKVRNNNPSNQSSTVTGGQQ
uniref:Uncharacterized protein n=1 Tax=Arion vulgaris TaxID=1028688 RepID=A0A0B7ADD7_9EUPU